MSIDAWLEGFFGTTRPDRLFHPDALWRDYLSFDWDLITHEGIDAIAKAKLPVRGKIIGQPKRHSNSEYIFDFQGPNGISKGLVEFQNGLALRLFTSFEETSEWDESFDPASAPPQVAILGAGQSGLALGARLQSLRIPYVIIEQNARVGDNWRARYDSLVLHDPTWVNHLPFKPFPDDWPTYTPKNKMGDWLEDYATDLSLNVQCLHKLKHAEFNDASSCWQLEIINPTGTSVLTVPQLVFAVGTSGFAQTPSFAGQETFEGQQLHSSAYQTGAEFTGKKVAIVGATNSAHDIAVDLVKNGAYPTMIQRSSTHVIPHEVYVNDILAPVWGAQLSRPIERSDFLSVSLPMRRLEQRGIDIFNHVKREWASFYENLENAGMTLDFADDGAGILGKYRRTASGYYIDVGGSQRVIDGEIGLRSGVGVKRVEQDGIVLTDNSSMSADAIIYATGFGSMEQWVAALIDKETAEKVGPCWGYGSGVIGDPGPWQGELRNMWKPTAQKNLWFMGGNLAQVRAMSRYLALQLQHQILGKR